MADENNTPGGKKKKAASSELNLDYRANKPMPDWVREAINTHLAIEEEDAKSAGAIGYMARALVAATMPYKDPKKDVFTRTNGDFILRIVAGYEGGIPFGIYPRLLISWVATEAVRKGSPVIELGESLSLFLRDVLELRSKGGGERGSSTRVNEAMKRLFGSLITAQYAGTQERKGFSLRNVMIADSLDLAPDLDLLAKPKAPPEILTLDKTKPEIWTPPKPELWTPQDEHEAGQWQSKVRLSTSFFKECVDNPIPIDLRAYKALRGSPLAMDIYAWLTHRYSYLDRRGRPIRWESLMHQFGTSSTSGTDQAVRDFKKGFLKALKMVHIVYPQANLEVVEHGLVLLPSRTHVASLKNQKDLF